jgi:hypothetical protein
MSGEFVVATVVVSFLLGFVLVWAYENWRI